ncbi:uncharacterized protein LY89DRAFT_730539 [Mollisia scopiformis]|uniref:Uncharacterized protein n=1 Tax=Mollisia scopiformis TaxID=149040 RepID=A0A194XJU8_MOLSC|nr:uncharacterized protein LY89DRAFT_730539 [Mollisia scopiformis]KUJ20500.1 hypothetical protein LY89DRAFT_730539 [Mollisia scopiformis]
MPPQPTHLESSLFCCEQITSIDENRKTFAHRILSQFAEYITQGPASPTPRVLDWSEAHLVDEAQYVIQYEKRWQSHECPEGLRYFIPEPGTDDFLEIPEDTFRHKNRIVPFHNNEGLYVKFSCTYHPGFLFVCQRLFRRTVRDPVVVPINKKHTRPDRTDEDDEDGNGPRGYSEPKTILEHGAYDYDGESEEAKMVLEQGGVGH